MKNVNYRMQKELLVAFCAVVVWLINTPVQRYICRTKLCTGQSCFQLFRCKDGATYIYRYYFCPIKLSTQVLHKTMQFSKAIYAVGENNIW